MVFFTDSWRPSSFYDRLAENAALGLHSLVLLDIKVKEPDLAALARGRVVYEPPRYMSAARCAAQLLAVEVDRGAAVCGPEALAVAAARVGAPDQRIAVGTLEQLARADLGPPLHSVVLVGRRTHELERDMLREWALDREVFDRVWERDYAGKR